MIFISFVNKYTKIDRRKIFLAKIVQVQRYRFHYWLGLEKPFNLVIYFYKIGAGNVEI